MTEDRIDQGDRPPEGNPRNRGAESGKGRRDRGFDGFVEAFDGPDRLRVDRGSEIENVPDAAVSPAAPTAYIANDGGFIHPLSGIADSKLVDRDLMVYALKAGYGRKGARIGSRDGDAELFKADMLAFWRRTLG